MEGLVSTMLQEEKKVSKKKKKHFQESHSECKCRRNETGVLPGWRYDQGRCLWSDSLCDFWAVIGFVENRK